MKSKVAEFIDFIAYERCLSKNTQEAYERDLLAFAQFIDEHKLECNRAAVSSFLQTLRDQNYASASVARMQIALKVFFRFLYREEYIEKDESNFFDSPKLWQKLPHVLTGAEINRLLSACRGNTKVDIRDKAILELLYGTGMRVSELCSLTLYNLEDDLLTVKGKGDKERLIPLQERVITAVDRYLNEVRSCYESDKNSSLFVTNRGNPIDRIVVWHMIKSRAKKACITKPISPHTLRHSYATHLLDGGADIRVIQELLGHAHISSTDRYTHVSRSQLQERFFACHPRK